MDWTVGIQDPNKARNTVLGQVKESNKTLVTSGIYERYLKVDGKTYHHLFDRETGYPFDNDIAGVTISPTNPSMVMVSQQPSSQWASKKD